ncbi:hypothetical protein F4703DRAFT_1905901 [Phycomyces blakesleeanus]
MYKHSNLGPNYNEWLKTAHLLDPPFDYFSFAELILKDKHVTNLIYKSILTEYVKKSNKYLNEGVKSLKLFESRTKEDGPFGSAFKKYWIKREEERTVESIRKRQLEGTSNITNDIVSNMERIIKKSCATSPHFSVSPSTSAISSTYIADEKTETSTISSEDIASCDISPTGYAYKK